MASKEGEQSHILLQEQGGDKKRRKVAQLEVKAMVYIEDLHARAIKDEALVKWHRKVQAAKNKCQEDMMKAGRELARSCKGTGMQTPVDITDWLQRRADDNPQ